MEAAFSVERQVMKNATVSVTYLNSRGVHQLFLRNADARCQARTLPTDIRPFGGNTNIYQYNSGGVFEQTQLIANFRVSVGTKLSLFGFYSLNFANSDLEAAARFRFRQEEAAADSAADWRRHQFPQFVSNSYDPMEDYGRAAFDVRNRLFIGGTISLPYALRLSPFIIADSGSPFNIIAGQDLNGDSISMTAPRWAVRPDPVARST